MKFEDEIKKVLRTINEADMGTATGQPAPAAGTNPAQPAANPAQVATNPVQQQPAGQQQEVTPDQLLQFALNAAPDQLEKMKIDPNLQGDDLFGAVQQAFTASQQQAQPSQAGGAAQPAAGGQLTAPTGV